jgi:hypothetical protein
MTRDLDQFYFGKRRFDRSGQRTVLKFVLKFLARKTAAVQLIEKQWARPGSNR